MVGWNMLPFDTLDYEWYLFLIDTVIGNETIISSVFPIATFDDWRVSQIQGLGPMLVKQS